MKYVKSFRGENIGYSHFEGVYLPLLWDAAFCFKNPIVLGYTRGHFTALVAMEHAHSVVVNECSGGCSGGSGAAGESCFYLPLSNADGQLLPVHFLSQAEVCLYFVENFFWNLFEILNFQIGRERAFLRHYLQLDYLSSNRDWG